MATLIMNCPICRKPASKVITRELRKSEKKKVFLCSRCELGILDSHQSAAELKQFYAKDYRRKPGLTSQSNPEELFATFSQYQDGRLKLLAPYLQPKTKLLE